jgi:hypothetical protein
MGIIRLCVFCDEEYEQEESDSRFIEEFCSLGCEYAMADEEDEEYEEEEGEYEDVDI